jgi:hypothetical protein
LQFYGVSEYLEDFVARIDAPLFKNLTINFFHQLIFDTPQLTQFISRTPKFKGHDKALVQFSSFGVSVTPLQPTELTEGAIELEISCKRADWQLSSLAQLCSSFFPPVLIPAVECLFIIEDGFPRQRWRDIECSQWLEVFHPFTGLKDLYISREFAPRIAPALQGLVGESVTEVLPALQTLFLEETLRPEPVQEAFEKFVAARQLAGHPISVSRWERKSKRIRPPQLETGSDSE